VKTTAPKDNQPGRVVDNQPAREAQQEQTFVDQRQGASAAAVIRSLMDSNSASLMQREQIQRLQSNASKPAQFNTLTYTPGQDMQIASRQERQLPHEAWHAVQYRLDQGNPPASAAPIQRVVETQYPIRGLFRKRKDYPRRVFFNRGRADLEDEEQKVEELANTDADLTLTAYASEDEAEEVEIYDQARPSVATISTFALEYSLETLNDLMNLRNKAVDDKLQSSRHTGRRTKKIADKNQIVGRTDYRKMRSVTVDVTGEEVLEPSSLVVEDPDELQAKRKSFQYAQKEAIKRVDKATIELALHYGKHREIIETYFGSGTVIMALIKKLTDLKAHIAAMSEVGRHQFVSSLDPRAEGSPAKNSGVGESSVITIRPRFRQDPMSERVDTLIHEGSHGTPSIKSEDYAYMDQRLFDFLEDEKKIANADNFVLFVRAILGRDVVEVRETPDDIYLGFEHLAEKQRGAKRIIALTEHALATTAQDLARVYQRAAAAFKENTGFEEGYYFDIANELAKDLGIAKPSTDTAPDLQDVVQLNGISQKFNAMRRFFAGNITVAVAEEDQRHPAMIDDDERYQVNVDGRFLEMSPKNQMKQVLGAIFDDYGMGKEDYTFIVRVCTEEAGFPTPLSD